MILAPFEIVNRSWGAGVITIGIRSTGKRSVKVTSGRGIVPIRVPVQTSPGPVENSVHGDARSGRGRKEQRPCEVGITWRGRAENQVPVTPQDANVVAVLVERMLPSSLANDAQQYLLAWMHVGIAVIGLVCVLRGIVGVHVIRHRAAVNQEINGVVRLSRNIETASHRSRCADSRCRDLLKCLGVNVEVHLGELEQVLAVVASFRVVVRSVRQPIITFTPNPLCQ